VIELLLQAERYMDMGLVDQADAIYRGLVASDPQNALAVAGMARVEIERGNDREAHRLAVQALAIDPDNGVARRLEARLYEVLTTRGERVDRPASAPGGAIRVTVVGAPEPAPAPGSGGARAADEPVEPGGAPTVHSDGEGRTTASGRSWLRRMLRRR